MNEIENELRMIKYELQSLKEKVSDKGHTFIIIALIILLLKECK